MRLGRPSMMLCLCSLAASAQTADGLTLSCSPDSPVAPADTSVTLRAFSSANQVNYAWTVTAGSVTGTGKEAQWNLSNVPPGMYRATVHIDGSSATTSCSIRLVVTEKLRSATTTKPALESGSTFLLRGQTEASGYGLYSYLLLGAPPVDSTRERYAQVIRAYLRLLPALEQLKENIRAKDLNATYLLLDAAPPAEVSADWVLQHYDYGRARSLLRLLPGQMRVGPYFVSSTNPLMGTSEIPRPYLLQDMSAVPTATKDLASWWVREFMNQSAQQRFWDTRNAEQFILKLRTTLAVLGAGLPEVRSSLKDWISWIS
jgi:hypothetical protein